MFETSGRLRYSRNSPDGERRLVADCDHEILRMYAGLSKLEWRPLNTPRHGAHVTVIKREGPIKNVDRWGTHDREIVKIELGPMYEMRYRKGRRGRIYCLKARCNRFDEIREFFGLPVYHSFHMTIGWH